MKHNSYFDGKVQSLSLGTDRGNATVGVIEPGRYSFSTSTEETMVIISGELKYKLPEGEWKTCRKGSQFGVLKGVKFEVEAASDAAYICYYK
jgi:hypothetical protein